MSNFNAEEKDPSPVLQIIKPALDKIASDSYSNASGKVGEGRITSIKKEDVPTIKGSDATIFYSIVEKENEINNVIEEKKEIVVEEKSKGEICLNGVEIILDEEEKKKEVTSIDNDEIVLINAEDELKVDSLLQLENKIGSDISLQSNLEIKLEKEINVEMNRDNLLSVQGEEKNEEKKTEITKDDKENGIIEEEMREEEAKKGKEEDRVGSRNKFTEDDRMGSRNKLDALQVRASISPRSRMKSTDMNINPESPADLAMRQEVERMERFASRSTFSEKISIMTHNLPKLVKKGTALGKNIDKEHELYSLTYGMMFGIRESVGLANQDMSKKLDERDFMDIDNAWFPVNGSMSGGAGNRPTPPHRLKGPFKFKDYAPLVFRKLRSRFGIDPVDYMYRLCGDFNYIEFISNSKSGQFFFYSSCGKYMIKTQTKTESKFLRRILPRYYVYVMKNPNTLLTRYYGMHRVKMYHINRVLHFTICQSVFDTNKTINVKYDLKGSHVGRKASAKDLKREHPVLKDCDFEERNEVIKLGPIRRKAFLNQIKDDTDFLCSLKIMDYSLLLGIHRTESSKSKKSVLEEEKVKEEEKKEENERGSFDIMEEERWNEESNIIKRHNRKLSIVRSVPYHIPIFTTEDGGMHGCEEATGEWNGDIYFCGVIDILQQYNTNKSLETFFKSFYLDRNEISSVNPEAYARRFVNFIDKNTR